MVASGPSVERSSVGGWNRKLVTARVFDRVGKQRVAVGAQKVPFILVCDSTQGLLLIRFGIFYFYGVPLIVNPSEELGENEGWKDRNKELGSSFGCS